MVYCHSEHVPNIHEVLGSSPSIKNKLQKQTSKKATLFVFVFVVCVCICFCVYVQAHVCPYACGHARMHVLVEA